jgi:hypothetical protein
MIEFLREGLAEAPIALGALVGFAIGGIGFAIAEIRDRRRRKRSKDDR